MESADPTHGAPKCGEAGREKGAERLCRGKQDLKPGRFCQRTANELMNSHQR